jgi:hypothetical protein
MRRVAWLVISGCGLVGCAPTRPAPVAQMIPQKLPGLVFVDGEVKGYAEGFAAGQAAQRHADLALAAQWAALAQDASHSAAKNPPPADDSIPDDSVAAATYRPTGRAIPLSQLQSEPDCLLLIGSGCHW